MRKLLLLCVICIATLTACVKPDVVVSPEFVEIHVPTSLLECADLPPVPGPDATQKDAAVFDGALTIAYFDCHDNLETVAQIIEDFNKAGVPQ